MDQSTPSLNNITTSTYLPRKTYVINLIGGPGVGKSMLACLLFIKLKELGKTVEIAFEYAKTLVWNHDFDQLNNQYWVSYQQSKLLKSMVGHVEFIIIDSSLLSGLYYNKENKDNTSNEEKTANMILKEYYSFNNINIFVERGNNVRYEQEGRLQTFEESKQASVELKNILHGEKVDFILYINEPKFLNVNVLVDYILKKSSEK